MVGSLACSSVYFTSLHPPPHCPFSPGTTLPLRVVQLMPVNSGVWKWDMQNERGMLQRRNFQRILEFRPRGFCWGRPLVAFRREHALKLAELAACRLCLEEWGKSGWTLLLLPFSGVLSLQPCEMLLELLGAFQGTGGRQASFFTAQVQRGNNAFQGEITPVDTRLLWAAVSERRRDQT